MTRVCGFFRSAWKAFGTIGFPRGERALGEEPLGATRSAADPWAEKCNRARARYVPSKDHHKMKLTYGQKGLRSKPPKKEIWGPLQNVRLKHLKMAPEM